MARHAPISYEQALTMPRGQILEWLGTEQQRWMRGDEPCAVPARDEARFQEFRKIMRLVDPGEAVHEAMRVVLGKPGPSYWDQLPTPNPEGLTHGHDHPYRPVLG
jgi:hypothetical protein